MNTKTIFTLLTPANESTVAFIEELEIFEKIDSISSFETFEIIDNITLFTNINHVVASQILAIDT